MIPPDPLVLASFELHIDKVFEDVETENVYESDISRMKVILGPFVWKAIENNVSELPDDFVEMWDSGYRQETYGTTLPLDVIHPFSIKRFEGFQEERISSSVSGIPTTGYKSMFTP